MAYRLIEKGENKDEFIVCISLKLHVHQCFIIYHPLAGDGAPAPEGAYSGVAC